MTGSTTETRGRTTDTDSETKDDELNAWTEERHRVDSVPRTLNRLPETSVHAIVATPDTDPSPSTESNRTRGGAGTTDMTTAHEEWASGCFRVLRPGGHLVTIAGPQTFYRMWSGIEDAGFEIRDTLTVLHHERYRSESTVPRVPSPVGISLIALARRPLPTSVSENLLEYGTGALNIDATRVPVVGDGEETQIGGGHVTNPVGNDGDGKGFTHPPPDHESGRYPPTVFFDQPTAEVLDEANGESVSSGGRAYHNTNDMYSSGWAIEEGQERDPGFGDTGGPSRYFHLLPQRDTVLSDSGVETRETDATNQAALTDVSSQRRYTLDSDSSTATQEQADNGRYYSLTVLADWLVNLLTREEQVVLEPFAEPITDTPYSEEGLSAEAVQTVCKGRNRRYIGFVTAGGDDKTESDASREGRSQ